MATGDKLIIPAQAAGFFSLFGNIKKGAGETLNLPEGMMNIGGNGKGYLLEAVTGWDPAANSDGSFSSLNLGDDVYIYAVQHASGIAQWVASKNSTVPTGFGADNSRKVGGFHYGRIRGVENRYNVSYTPVVGIVPNSCWDLRHRPTCDPTGMAEVVPGKLWADIYLASEGAGSWPNTVPVSRFSATPLTGTEGYSRYLDYPVLAANAGKRIPQMAEWFAIADGSPQGSDSNNDTAWSATSNSGRTATGTVAKAISSLNIVDCVGNVWEMLTDNYDVGSTSSSDYNYDKEITEHGQDAGEQRGEIYHRLWRIWIAGGYWTHGARCGSRSVNANHTPWHVNSTTGLRLVCDSL